MSTTISVALGYVSRIPIREAMRKLCEVRWWQETSALTLVPGMGNSSFQSERRQLADAFCNETYVVADDDCFPQAAPFADAARRILEAHPSFGILSLRPTNFKINPWRPEGYEPYEDEEVFEHVSVGGIRFCRPGCLEEWPPQTRKGYDTEHCEALRKAGYRVGYFKNLWMSHLGEGYSSVS